ncbi:MAG: helix-turn-helix domain-containing protein [Candidatus Limimorpha sp.]
MDDIKSRLSHILRSRNLTATQFADLVGIGPSNVSHLLSGRNKPSFDFLVKLKEVFPEYNLDWIMLGKKPITINDPSPIRTDNASLFSDLDDDTVKFTEDVSVQNTTSCLNDDVGIPDNQVAVMDNPQIKKIIIVYDDNTFDEIIRRQ